MEGTIIAPRPTNGCPINTIDGIDTCFCVDHCSWHKCRLAKPPIKCLENTVFEWKWNSSRNHWTAKGYSCTKYNFVSFNSSVLHTFSKLNVL